MSNLYFLYYIYHRNICCKIEYIVDPEDIFSTGPLVMCRYSMHIRACEGIAAVGDCVQYGMLQCLFSPGGGRIAAVEFVFDVMTFMQQLQVIASSDSIVVVVVYCSILLYYFI